MDGAKSLETHALDAIIVEDDLLAADLIEQLTPHEAEIVRDAATRLAEMANDVFMDGTVRL